MRTILPMKPNSQIATHILIREANAQDIDVIVQLIQQLACASGEHSPITPTYVCSYLGATNNQILLVEREGQVEGLLSYSVRPDLYHAGNSVLIEELVVDERCRGQGLGSALIAAFMERVEELDAKEVCLAVMPDNEHAISFYHSHGLVEEALFLEKHL